MEGSQFQWKRGKIFQIVRIRVDPRRISRDTLARRIVKKEYQQHLTSEKTLQALRVHRDPRRIGQVTRTRGIVRRKSSELET